MNYRGVADRRISTYAALIIIALFGAGATLTIVHAASNTVLTPDVQNGVLSAL